MLLGSGEAFATNSGYVCPIWGGRLFQYELNTVASTRYIEGRRKSIDNPAGLIIYSLENALPILSHVYEIARQKSRKRGFHLCGLQIGTFREKQAMRKRAMDQLTCQELPTHTNLVVASCQDSGLFEAHVQRSERPSTQIFLSTSTLAYVPDVKAMTGTFPTPLMACRSGQTRMLASSKLLRKDL